ncbi:MAG: hypothetical protein IT204_15595 [Fimbriimonadaceae bacterium]|nr:hypothetical protein [Fimbriimonadaceae bacterium]
MFRATWLLLCLAPALAQTDLGRELVTNGTFAADANRDGFPDGFGGDRATLRLVSEDGNPFIRLGRAGQRSSGGVGATLKLQPAWFKLSVSVRVRARDIVPGPESWHNARIAMSFHDAAGTQVGGWPNVLNWQGSTTGWVTAQRDYRIPDGATELRLSASLFEATGEVDYDDLSVQVSALRPTLQDAAAPAGLAWGVPADAGQRYLLNGWWRFRPLWESPLPTAVPATGQGWGYLKVPAAWPGYGNESTRPRGPDIWELQFTWPQIHSAWYERPVTVPAAWAGRRWFLDLDLPQTAAEVWVGGQRLGELRWPGGRIELTTAVPAGQTATLRLRVTTDPLAADKLVRMREDLVQQLKAEVRVRGLVGDVALVSEPRGPRLGTLQVRPSVRRKLLGLALRPQELLPGAAYRVTASATPTGASKPTWTARSGQLGTAQVRDGSLLVELPWPNPQLWDFEQPRLYDLTVQLQDAAGQVLDTQTTRCGFREFWLRGRDLILNGTPVRWRALFFAGPTGSEALMSPSGVRLFIRRARALGFNFAILSNYSFDPGETHAFGSLLRTCDEEGFAISFSLPHPLRTPGATGSGLEELWLAGADYAVRTAGNHPCVLAYAMTHNALGYHGDQNPAKMDGVHQQRPSDDPNHYFNRSRQRAAAAEAYVRAADPTRELYHHQSGNMGSWHTVNIYLNWSPPAERSEWLSHWASAGTKPLFFVEWGAPHQASWGGHRQGPFIWRNNVNSEPLGIDYGAMHFGDAAYRPDPTMEKYVDAYERVYARQQPFHISSVLGTLWDTRNELNNIDLKTFYTDLCWPRLRTWGLSAVLPWDQGMMAYAASSAPEPLPAPAASGGPGVQPDLLNISGDHWSSFLPTWEYSSWGRSLQRWNQPLVAYLAGDPNNFCERGHNVTAGETLTKQVVLLNDSRAAVSGTFSWRLSGGRAPLAEGQGRLSAAVGGQARVPFQVAIPRAASGLLTLSIRARLGAVEQTDQLDLHVVAAATASAGRLAVFDPAGQTSHQLAAAKIPVTALSAAQPVPSTGGLLIGREAVSASAALPDLRPLLARGGRVVVFEQTAAALTHRLGFRCNDPSLREVFVRVAAHPVLAGLDTARLRDWRGEATLLPRQLDLPAAELRDPPHDWLGFDNTRVWKWGNTGQVASVVIETPQRGDFLPLVQGGFDLQYAPLLLQRVGGGEILWCQLDVTGRRGSDPAANRLWRQIVAWAATSSAATQRPTRYLGDAAGAALLASLGVDAPSVAPAQAAGPGLLIVGPAAGERLTAVRDALATAVAGGATVLALAQTAESLRGWLPFEVATRSAARTVSPLPTGPWFEGLGPGDLRWRGRREVLLVGGPGREPNVLQAVPHGAGAYLFCQTLPTDWDYADPYRVYLKPTARRSAVMLSRLLANLGAAAQVATLQQWQQPAPPTVDLSGAWQAAQDPAGSATPTALPAAWQPLQVPATFESQVSAWAAYDGVVWYRRSFTWTGPLDQPVELLLGAIDDEDWTWVNGRAVGHIGQDTHPADYWSVPRRYTVPPGALRAGPNELLVKVRDLRQSGGLVGGAPQLRLPARWLASYYLDTPAQLDDPYRYNRW